MNKKERIWAIIGLLALIAWGPTYWYLTKDPTMTDIVNEADKSCEKAHKADLEKALCVIGYVKEYCDLHWKNDACHEFQKGLCE